VGGPSVGGGPGARAPCPPPLKSGPAASVGARNVDFMLDWTVKDDKRYVYNRIGLLTKHRPKP